MKTSDNGKKLIKKYEGFSSTPYLCPAKVPTIGYGATYYPNGKVLQGLVNRRKDEREVFLK